MYAVSAPFELVVTFLKLSVNLYLHRARLPTPDNEGVILRIRSMFDKGVCRTNLIKQC